MTTAQLTSFRATSYSSRVYSGVDALANLEQELSRHGTRRAFVICGHTVSHRTDLLQRISSASGPRYAGFFDRIDKDCSYSRVAEATDAAREAGADLIVAVGGGSVIQGARVVVILLGEKQSAFKLMTQYPEISAAVSPRLLAPKMPIINIPTTPTSAMNRGGSALKNLELDHRMEFFDPKTRPAAIFWDADALLTAPWKLVRSTGTTTYTGALQNVAAPPANPLAEGDNLQAYRLAAHVLPRLASEPNNADLRISLCASALLQNRAVDDGLARGSGRMWSTAYALATALHIRYEHVGQGESTSSVTPGLIRAMGADSPGALRLAETLDILKSAMTVEAAAQGAADKLEQFYRSLGMPAAVRELDIPESDLPQLARDTLKNFNANPGMRPADHFDNMLSALRACW
jgi:alcohol dehydrogenase class IV